MKNTIIFPKHFGLDYLKFQDGLDVNNPRIYRIYKESGDEYLCLGVKSGEAIFHKIYEFYGSPKNPTIDIYDYKNGFERISEFKPFGIDVFTNKLMSKYFPEYFI